MAYAVQFDLMDSTVRNDILTRYPDTEPFPTLIGVNEFTYGFDPERFAILAYKTYMAKGGAEFIRKLLAFEIALPSMSPPFAVLPHEQGL